MADEWQSYLEQLKFDRAWLKGWVASYLTNVRLMIMFILAVTAVGVWAYLTMPRSLNPEVELPIVTVGTAFPGASPDSVETLVTIPIENGVKKVKGLSTYSSTSQEGFSLVFLEFTSEVSPQTARDEVRAVVDQITLPDDAMDPQIQELDFEDIPVWTFALIKKSNSDTASLMRLSETIQAELESMAMVDRVELSGFDRQEIQVLIDPTTIKERQLDPMSLAGSLRTSLLSFPGGLVYTDRNQLSLGMNASADNLTDLRELPLAINGQTYRLGQIATVMERSVPGQQPTLIATPNSPPQNAVQFSAYRTKTTQFDEAAKAMEAKVNELVEPYQDGYEVVTIANYNNDIDIQFGDLVDNFWQTLALVAGTMFLIYGLRQATVASLAIPFPLLITFAVMVVMGISLNFLSIFSLLIALGLFVDNAVVIIEGFSSYYRSGKFTPLQTAILVWRDFSIPLISINLVTVWAFLPLLLSQGIIGEFIRPLPIIVSASMFASVLIALLFTLPSMMLLANPALPKRVKYLINVLFGLVILAAGWLVIPSSPLKIPTFFVFILLLAVLLGYRGHLSNLWQNTKNRFAWSGKIESFFRRILDQGLIDLRPISAWYRRQIIKLMATRSARLKTLAFVLIFTLATYLLLPLGFIRNEFFPNMDMDQLFVYVELPLGTRADLTSAEMQSLLDDVRQTPGTRLAVGQVGQGGGGNVLTNAGGGPNTITITLLLEPAEQRELSSMEIAQQLRDKYIDYTNGNLQIQELSAGPPAGADVQLTILGEDLNIIEGYVTQLEEYLNQQEGVTNVNKSVKPGASKLTFEPDLDQLQSRNLSESQVGYWLRLLGSGTNLATARFGNDEQDITLRFSPEIAQAGDINQLEIPGPQGYTPLALLGNLKLEQNPTVIARENGQRSMSVTAEVLDGYSVSLINQELQNYADSQLDFPQGYSWKTGGVNEENAESVESTLQAMAISAILILISMVVQLKSFRKAILVMLVIPLAISGVFFWFAVTNTPLSYPALIGLLSLFGIVVANSIVLVDKINQNLEAGLIQRDAIVDAAASRLEPIALTSFASIVGLIPITLADPLWRGLGGSIIAGLSFSGTLMLFFIPVVYYYFFPQDQGNVKSKKRR